MTKVPMTYEGAGVCQYMQVGVKPFLRMDYGSESEQGAKDRIVWYSATDNGFQVVSSDVAKSLELMYENYLRELLNSESSAHSPRPAPQG